MTAELKAMLDELMGKDRDMSLDEKSSRGEHWSDDHVSCCHTIIEVFEGLSILKHCSAPLFLMQSFI